MTMEGTYQATSHFHQERRDRFFNVVLGGIGILILGYFHVIYPSTTLILCLVACILLIANYSSSPKIDLFKHAVNFLFGIAAYPVISLAPTDAMSVRLVSLTNALSIGFEQRTWALRLLYSLISALPWLIISNNKEIFQFNECYSQIMDSDLKAFVCCFMVLMLISASHSDLEVQALRAAETALSELKVINAKYEQANRELNQILEDKDNFILLFSHETRNPLNILMGNLSILLNEIQTPRIRARITRAKFCAELLLHNLNNILDTGKLINKGNLEIAPVTVNLSQYLHSIWDIVKMMAMKKQLHPMLVIPKPLPTFLKLDLQRTSQIIINLVSNAVKFTSLGSISLNISYLKKQEISEQDFLPSSLFGNKLATESQEEEGSFVELDRSAERRRIDNSSFSFSSFALHEFGDVTSGSRECYSMELMRELKINTSKLEETSTDSEGEGYLKVEVVDTGCGMKKEDTDKLFQKFSQVSLDASQRQIGTGLGLWISKTLAELMDGGIRVYSKPNVGTTFVFVIKADFSTPRKETILRNSTKSLDQRKLSTQRILLVDDDPYNLETHIQLLKALGCTNIDTATDGYGLFNQFKSKPENYYDIIFTDINMPNLNGVEAAKLLRQFESSAGRNQAVKIGFVTGHSNDKEKQICESPEIGASFYLSKPLTLATLKGALYSLSLYGSNACTINTETVSYTLSTEIKSKRKPVVLCVDDDILNLEIFEDLISSLGAKPIRASSGKEAVKVFSSRLMNHQDLDLVLIDCLMPGVDGWTASTEMKKIADNVPVIGVTGVDVKRNEAKFKASGMNEMIRKPIQREDLVKILARYVSTE